MNPIIQSKYQQIIEICVKYKVKRLILYGSVVSGGFNQEHSDLDFLVDFHSMTPGERAEAYFSILFDLEHIFQLPIDLIERETIQNPYLLESIEVNKEVIYEVA
jgi:hypothetical protein